LFLIYFLLFHILCEGIVFDIYLIFVKYAGSKNPLFHQKNTTLQASE
jgi:hypothetical protein